MGRGLAAFLATSFMSDVAMDIVVPISWWPRSFIRTVLELLLRLLCHLHPASHSPGQAQLVSLLAFPLHSVPHQVQVQR